MYSAKDPSFRTLYRRSIILPIGLMALLIAALIWMAGITAAQIKAERQASAVISETNTIQDLFITGASGLRGFQLTHEPKFLTSYLQSRSQLPGEFQILNRLLVSEPLQQARLKEIESQYRNWIILHSNSRKPLSPRAEVTQNLTTKLLVDMVRGLIAQIQRGEFDVLEGALVTQQTTVYWLLFGLGGIAVLFAAFVSYQSVRAIKELSGRYESALTTVQHQANELRASRDELDKRVEERTRDLNAANRELEIFCYSAAHDLRGPLRWIIGTNRLFVEDYGNLVPEEGLKELEKVNSAASRLSKLIDSLLEMARLGKAEINKERVDMSELCAQTVREIKARDWGGPVSVEIQPGLQIEGDPILISMLVQNLLENAFKFCGKTGEGKVTVSGKRENGSMVLSVQDNGVGFDSAHEGKLFQPFERLHRDEEFAGTGMGLANARRIVERHGGKIWADGKPGHGATFSFSLPAKD